MHRIAVCLISMEVQGERPFIRVVLNPDSPKRPPLHQPKPFTDLDDALDFVRRFAENWRDEANLATDDEP